MLNIDGSDSDSVALKVGSYSFPREQAAMMTGIASGSWALVNYVLLQFLGPLLSGALPISRRLPIA